MRRLALVVALAILAAPLAADGQPAGRPFRLGFLGTTPPPDPAGLWEAFLEGLRDLGYVEGKNLAIERRYSEGISERLRELAAELVRLNVDVIVATGGPPPHAAKRATTTIPIVITNHADPVGSGLVASLARPGGNITGLSILNPDIIGKQVQLLQEAVPRVTRLAVLWNPDNPTHARSLSAVASAARSLGVELQVVEARTPGDLAGAFSTMTRASVSALIVLGDAMFWGRRNAIAELAMKQRLPTVAVQREHAEAGTLITYGANLRDNFRRAAIYVDKILKGARPGDLPIEQPTRLELVVNLKTAKTLGLTIPPSVLARADAVIQ